MYMKIVFKYPTYQRPELFKKTLNIYYSMLSGKHKTRFVININHDDKSMNSQNMTRYMESKTDLICVHGDYRTKIEACNDMAFVSDYDVLVLISDDMTPVVYGYDDIIALNMEQYFPDLFGALCFFDGKVAGLMTLPVLGKPIIEKLGYIYHPSYQSFYCDTELTEMLKVVNKIQFIDNMIIRHDYKLYGTDAVYNKNSHQGKKDKITFEMRTKKGFDVCKLVS